MMNMSPEEYIEYAKTFKSNVTDDYLLQYQPGPEYTEMIEIFCEKGAAATNWLKDNKIEYHLNTLLNCDLQRGWTGLKFSFKRKEDAMLFKMVWS